MKTDLKILLLDRGRKYPTLYSSTKKRYVASLRHPLFVTTWAIVLLKLLGAY